MMTNRQDSRAVAAIAWVAVFVVCLISRVRQLDLLLLVFIYFALVFLFTMVYSYIVLEREKHEGEKERRDDLVH